MHSLVLTRYPTAAFVHCAQCLANPVCWPGCPCPPPFPLELLRTESQAGVYNKQSGRGTTMGSHPLKAGSEAAAGAAAAAWAGQVWEDKDADTPGRATPPIRASIPAMSVYGLCLQLPLPRSLQPHPLTTPEMGYRGRERGGECTWFSTWAFTLLGLALSQHDLRSSHSPWGQVAPLPLSGAEALGKPAEQLQT